MIYETKKNGEVYQWYTYKTGAHLAAFSDSYKTSNKSRFKLKHPELTVQELNGRPILWFVLRMNENKSLDSDSNSVENRLLSDFFEDNLDYSNPVETQFIIKVTEPQDLTIFSSNGQLVFQAKLQEDTNKLNIDNLNPGVYYFRLSNNNGTFKIIKL